MNLLLAAGSWSTLIMESIEWASKCEDLSQEARDYYTEELKILGGPIRMTTDPGWLFKMEYCKDHGMAPGNKLAWNEATKAYRESLKSETIKEQLDKATGASEELIRVVLQEYHDRTGMTPQSINFEYVYDTKMNDPRHTVVVTRVILKATT